MRHGILVFAFVLAAGLLLDGDLTAGSLEPPGPPAPTMKDLGQVEPRTAISSLPVTIAAPGNYYLTGDLVGVSGQVGINITSSFVALDLNGFSLIGVPGSLDGIRATVAGTEHCVIRNGVIRDWGGRGLSATATEVHAEHLRIDNNLFGGLLVGSRSIVRDTTSTGNSGYGIEVGSSSTIIACTAGSNSSSGFLGGTSSVMSGSTASNNGIGFQLGIANVATDCTALLNVNGFTLNTGARVSRSTARQNTSIGINGVGEGASIEECTSDMNTDDGIRVNNRALVRGNFARNNGDDGIQAIGAENRIEENESHTNVSAGIRVNGGISNLVVRNSASGNAIEFSINAGNKAGAISTDPLTANPWANFDL